MGGSVLAMQISLSSVRELSIFRSYNSDQMREDHISLIPFSFTPDSKFQTHLKNFGSLNYILIS